MFRNSMAGETVRLELRALASDVELWKAEAQRQRVSVSEFVRTAAREAARPSAFRLLMDELRDRVSRHRLTFRDRASGITLTREQENALLTATAPDVGAEVYGKLVTAGPRVAFASILGCPVTRWDAPDSQIVCVDA